MGNEIKTIDEDRPETYGDNREMLKERIVELAKEVRNYKLCASERSKVLTKFVDHAMALDADEARGQGRLKLGQTG